jgi:hypothetical protein
MWARLSFLLPFFCSSSHALVHPSRKQHELPTVQIRNRAKDILLDNKDSSSSDKPFHAHEKKRWGVDNEHENEYWLDQRIHGKEITSVCVCNSSILTRAHLP